MSRSETANGNELKFGDGPAVIVGASGGVGKAVCRTLADLGVQVVAADLDVHDLAAEPSIDEARAVDASNPEQVQAMASSVVTEFGAPSVLVNAQGLWRPMSFFEISADDFEVTYRANLLSVFTVCQAFLPVMADVQGASVVNFASSAAEQGPPIAPGAHYGAAKAAVIGLTKALAREMAPKGIRVNAISPGPIDTPMIVPEEQSVAFRERMADRTLVGRIGSPDDMASAVAYLASNQAGFITGEVLRVNGGVLL